MQLTSYSRKKKGSKNREKARQQLARSYEKLVNQRNDFLYELSRFYINNYEVICAEDLRITNLVKNHYYAQKILDASLGKFLQLLAYKAESAGRLSVKVNPRGTSQEGAKALDKDYRASWNILKRGSNSLRALVSGLGHHFEPVERRPLLRIPAQTVITGQVSSVKQEAPCVSWE